MKRKKRNQLLSCFLCICMFCTALFPMQAFASDSFLLKLGEITITQDMSLTEVTQLLGEPKLVTPSIFGGSAYAFYTGNYENYVYLETNEQNEIVSYGSISPGFETDQHKYGDSKNSTNSMSGWVSTGFAKEETIFGAIDYVENKITYKEVKDRFYQNVECRKGISMQATEMANALLALKGETFKKEFREDIFYYIEQIHNAQGLSAYTFFNNIGKANYYDLITTGPVFHIGCYPNPLELAQNVHRYADDDVFTTYNLSYFIDSDTNGIYYDTGFVNPDFIQTKSSVPYTEEEKAQLAQGRALYKESLELWNSTDTYYKEEPVYESLPLTAGEIHEDILKSTVLYVNAIRAGAGIGPLTYSPEISKAAQNKAVMVVYTSHKGLPGGHIFPQPDGVSDEMYQSGMSYMNENLFMSGILSGSLISSINYALDDGPGEPWTAGHRYNLLEPSHTEAGFGEVGVQAVHKFAGSNNKSVEMVAWPSKGIAALESIRTEDFNWTVKFYENYSITKDTTVQAKLLNDGQTWNFNLTDIPSCTMADDIRYQIFPEANQIAFYHAKMPLDRGNVYEITLNHLTNASGEDCSYQYRTVLEEYYVAENSGTVEDIQIKEQSIQLEQNSSARITVSFTPEAVTNPIVFWHSENPDVATVNQFGVVTGKQIGTATICATSMDGSLQASCTVEVVKDLPDPEPTPTPGQDPTPNPTPTPGENPTPNPTPTPGPSDPSPDTLPFIDVTSGDWFYNGVAYNYYEGLMTGMDSTHFGPYGFLSRAQFALILYRMSGSPDTDAKNTFLDLSGDEWYADAVLWAQKNGIVNGYVNGCFGPADMITREQMALMMHRYANYLGKDTSFGSSYDQFADRASVSPFAADAMGWAIEKGIITGKDNGTRIDPQGNTARAECALIIQRFMNNVNVPNE